MIDHRLAEQRDQLHHKATLHREHTLIVNRHHQANIFTPHQAVLKAQTLEDEQRAFGQCCTSPLNDRIDDLITSPSLDALDSKVSVVQETRLHREVSKLLLEG